MRGASLLGVARWRVLNPSYANNTGVTGPAAVTLVRCVVVNFNGGDLVDRCVASLLAEASPQIAVQVVVVDNASTDGSAARLAGTYGDRVHLVRNATNAGYVAANVGMGRLEGLADPDHVALVNPDATLEPGCLAALVAALEADPTAGAAAPCMRFAHRFAEVELRAPAEPSGGDPRALAVQLWGVVATAPETPSLDTPSLDTPAPGAPDRLGQLAAGEGVGDVEELGTRRFRWLGPTATLGVPVPLEATALTARLTLSSPRPKDVVLRVPAARGAPREVTVAVGPTPTTVEVSLDPTLATDRIANAGSQVFDDGAGADRGHFAPVGPPFDEPGEVFAWCGGGVLLRGDYLRDVGLFEPSLFLYYEDTDLSWRGRSRGWHYVYVPDALVRHVQGASGGAGSDRFVVSTTRNRIVVAVRNAPAPVARRALAATLGELWSSLRHEVLVPLTRLRRPVTRMAGLRLRGLASALAALPAALVARRRLGRMATVDRATAARGLVPRHGGGHH